MRQITPPRRALIWLVLRCVFVCFLLSCGRGTVAEEATTDEMVHVNLAIHASTLLLGVSDAVVSDIVVRRLECPGAEEPLDYKLQLIPSEKIFVLNEQRKAIEGCQLQLQEVTVAWKELSVVFNVIGEQKLTAEGLYEGRLENSSRSASLYFSMPGRVSAGTPRDIFWSVNVAYSDSKSQPFPNIAQAREEGTDSLALSLSQFEDRGVLNSIWREFGVTLSCTGAHALGVCNGYELLGTTARLVLQSGLDVSVAEQIRAQGKTPDLRFTAGLTHLVGSGLRFTIAVPHEWFGQKLYLIVMRGQGYSVFDVAPDKIVSQSQ